MSDKPAPDTEALSVPTTPTSPVMAISQQAVNLDQLPDGYYRSKNFVGSLIAVCLMAISLFLGYVLPVCCIKGEGERLIGSTRY